VQENPSISFIKSGNLPLMMIIMDIAVFGLIREREYLFFALLISEKNDSIMKG